MFEDKNYNRILDYVTDPLEREGVEVLLVAQQALSTRINKLKKLCMQLDKTGVGLGAKWRKGMKVHYATVIEELTVELRDVESKLDLLYGLVVNGENDN